MSQPRIALVTTHPARTRDEDLAPLVEALQRAGAEVGVEDWDDASVDWASYEVAVLRSTWDYMDRLDEFLAWLDRAAAQGPQGKEMFISRQKMGRLGTAEEIASMAVYLGSDESAFTTGVDLVVDGGYML